MNVNRKTINKRLINYQRNKENRRERQKQKLNYSKHTTIRKQRRRKRTYIHPKTTNNTPNVLYRISTSIDQLGYI